MNRLHRAGWTPTEWNEQHSRNEAMLTAADALIVDRGGCCIVKDASSLNFRGANGKTTSGPLLRSSESPLGSRKMRSSG
jgi:hypothetical protein